jgi:hypothetical protein
VGENEGEQEAVIVEGFQMRTTAAQLDELVKIREPRSRSWLAISSRYRVRAKWLRCVAAQPCWVVVLEAKSRVGARKSPRRGRC